MHEWWLTEADPREADRRMMEFVQAARVFNYQVRVESIPNGWHVTVYTDHFRGMAQQALDEEER